VDVALHAFRLVSRRKPFHFDRAETFEPGFAISDEYLRRFDGKLEYRGARVLDVGCGLGQTCIRLVERGAREAVGVDISRAAVDFGNEQIAMRGLSDRVQLRHIEDIADVDESFDVAVSQNSFEHIQYPERMIDELCERLRPGAQLAIGFSALWNSPWGGHIRHMTPLPWAHLIFPERIIISEQNRFYPPELHGRMGRSYAEYGLNQMTFRRFHDKMTSSGLREEFFVTNTHRDRWRSDLFGALRHLPGGAELFTFNVYGVWRKPQEERANPPAL
jgi:SAM-dependent methyltransferase